jgi:hypothetical protein
VFQLFNKATIRHRPENLNIPQTGAFLIGNVLNTKRFLTHILVPVPEYGFMKNPKYVSSYHFWENKILYIA